MAKLTILWARQSNPPTPFGRCKPLALAENCCACAEKHMRASARIALPTQEHWSYSGLYFFCSLQQPESKVKFRLIEAACASTVEFFIFHTFDSNI